MKLTLKVIVIAFIAGFCGAYVLYYFAVKPSLQKVEEDAQLQPVHYSADEQLFTAAVKYFIISCANSRRSRF